MDKTLSDLRGQATTIAETAAVLGAITPPAWLFDRDRRIVFAGSGSSYYIGGLGAELAAAIAGVDAQALPSSDIWLLPGHHLRDGDVLVVVSRTGTTIEGVRALQIARGLGVRTVAISLGTDVPLSEEADWSIVLPHVNERGRVMTRSVSNLIATVTWLAAQFASVAGRGEGVVYLDGVAELGGTLSSIARQQEAAAQEVAKRGFDHHVILASGPLVPLAHEIALKFNEMTQLRTESYSILEYRHGPVASMGPGTLVSIIAPSVSVPFARLVVEDVRILGGTSLVVETPDEGRAELRSDVAWKVPIGFPDWMIGSLALPYFQFLIYHVTIELGKDPERVRNLDATHPPYVNPHFPDIQLP